MLPALPTPALVLDFLAVLAVGIAIVTGASEAQSRDHTSYELACCDIEFQQSRLFALVTQRHQPRSDQTTG